ncbi:hypothetical protein N9Y60_03865 [Crocinitomicaceae bacterium]|nr:hypothetical protein [Crocinitomicaceae bacterium]MDB3906139.1 hypothetical protein [Crocinitomicaceae bacterium]
MRFTTKNVSEKDDSVILLICAVVVALITLFFTYGIEHFEWVIFTLYAVFIFMGEFLMSSFIFRRDNILYTIASIASGSAIGIVFVLKAILPFW